MIIAQSLVEYGVIESLVAGFDALGQTISVLVHQVGETTWVTLGAVVLILAVLWSRRSPRF
jgi:hypothetical protein